MSQSNIHGSDDDSTTTRRSLTETLPTELLDGIGKFLVPKPNDWASVAHMETLYQPDGSYRKLPKNDLYASLVSLSIVDRKMHRILKPYTIHPRYRNFSSFPSVTKNLSEYDEDILLAHPPADPQHLSYLVTKLQSLAGERSTGLKLIFGRTFFDAFDDRLGAFWGEHSKLDEKSRQKAVTKHLKYTVDLLSKCQIQQVSYLQPPEGHYGFNKLRSALKPKVENPTLENTIHVENQIIFIDPSDETSVNALEILMNAKHTTFVIESRRIMNGQYLETLYDTGLREKRILTKHWTFVNRVGNEPISSAGEVTDEAAVPTWNDQIEWEIRILKRSGPISSQVRVLDVSEAGELASYSGKIEDSEGGASTGVNE